MPSVNKLLSQNVYAERITCHTLNCVSVALYAKEKDCKH